MTESTSTSTSTDPCAIVTKLLQNTSDPAIVSSLCTPDCTYVSLTYDNPALKKILPFAGRHVAEGPSAILNTFATVAAIWEREEFTIDALFAGENYVAPGAAGAGVFETSGMAETEPQKQPQQAKVVVVDVSMWGSFTLRSRTTGRAIRSPYCIWFKVDTEKEKVVYMHYMEDTLMSTSVLKSEEGYGKFKVFPGGEEVDV